MDLNFTEEEEQFRQEVQDFIKAEYSPEMRARVQGGAYPGKEITKQWHSILYKRGWVAKGWPVEYGGTGWGPVKQFIFELESRLAQTPSPIPFGLNMLGPVLMKFGSEEQQKYYLPRILDGTDWWCQGYSEPGSGSDLASLRTTAVRDGDHYIINGQKTWTTLAQYADKMFCLVRTSSEGKLQEGISFILFDMNTPGIEIRPIITIEGGHEVNDVFFTDVRVPAENLVGEENMGWTYAKFLLTHERTDIANIGGLIANMQRMKAAAAKRKKNGKSLMDDPHFSARVARAEIALENLKTTNLRVLASVIGGGAPGPESSLLKIKSTEIYQEITSLQRRAMGPYATPHIPEALEHGYNGPHIGPPESLRVAESYFNNRKVSIFGGSNEIQKNIVSKAMLRL